MDVGAALGTRALNLRPLANSSVLFLGLAYGVLLSIAGGAGLFGFWLALLLWLSIWRYSYEILRTIAQGRSWLAGPGVETMNPVGEWGVVLHFLFFGVALVFFQTTPFFGEGGGAWLVRWIGTAALGAVFPASAALLSFTRNLSVAMNPMSVAGVMRTMRMGYLKLLAALFGLGLGVDLLTAFVGNGIAGSFVANVVSTWGMFAAFALIGGAVHEHRDDFDIPGERKQDAEVRASDREREWQKTLDRAYASIRGGLPAQGYRTIKVLIAAENDSPEIYGWLFARMLEWEDRSHALELASRYIERLIATGAEHGALELIAQCRRIARDFVVPPAAAVHLAGYARSIGRHGLADELAAVNPRARHP